MNNEQQKDLEWQAFDRKVTQISCYYPVADSQVKYGSLAGAQRWHEISVTPTVNGGKHFDLQNGRSAENVEGQTSESQRSKVKVTRIQSTGYKCTKNVCIVDD